jgi:hypothetical protein
VRICRVRFKSRQKGLAASHSMQDFRRSSLCASCRTGRSDSGPIDIGVVGPKSARKFQKPGLIKSFKLLAQG